MSDYNPKHLARGQQVIKPTLYYYAPLDVTVFVYSHDDRVRYSLVYDETCCCVWSEPIVERTDTPVLWCSRRWLHVREFHKTYFVSCLYDGEGVWSNFNFHGAIAWLLEETERVLCPVARGDFT